MSQNDPHTLQGVQDLLMREGGLHGVRISRRKVQPYASRIVANREDPEAAKAVAREFTEKFKIGKA